MSTNSSAVPSDGKGRQALSVNSHEIAIIDCGCWDNANRYFGAMSGSVAILARMNDLTSKDEPCFSNLDESPKAVPLFGLSQTHVSVMHELSPVLLRFLKQLVRVGPSGRFCVEILDEPYIAQPVIEDEDARRGKLLCPSDEMYLFLPDMHLGVLDRADNFAQQSANPLVQIENLTLLKAVVEPAQKLGAKIYQMGDFLDIWEVEACLEQHPIYFGKPVSDVTMVDAAGPDQRPWREDRRRRSVAAEALILQRWWDLAPVDFQYIRSKAGIRWIHGNHDVEVGAVGEDLVSAPRATGDAGHWRFGPERPQSVWIQGAWAAEHGHYYDRFNDTHGVATVPEVLEKVPGKTVTYANARREREEHLPFVEIPTGNEGLTKKYLIHDPADTFLDDMSNATAFVHMLAHHPLRTAAIAGDFAGLQFSPFVPHVHDGAGMGERANFDDMRCRLLDELVAQLEAMNPNASFPRRPRIEFDSPNRGNIPFLFAPRGGVVDGKPCAVPTKVPFRVLFHGHTHQPLVLRLQLRAVPYDSNEGVRLRLGG